MMVTTREEQVQDLCVTHSLTEGELGTVLAHVALACNDTDTGEQLALDTFAEMSFAERNGAILAALYPERLMRKMTRSEARRHIQITEAEDALSGVLTATATCTGALAGCAHKGVATCQTDAATLLDVAQTVGTAMDHLLDALEHAGITQPDAPAADVPQTFDFGEALHRLKAGRLVARLGWNGKGMFLYFVNGGPFRASRKPLMGIYPEGTEIAYRDHIDMKAADGSCMPWVASQTDMIAEDWVEIARP